MKANNSSKLRLSTISGYEKRILSDVEKTKADEIKDTRILTNAVKKVLNLKIDEDLEGEIVNVSIVEMLAAKKIAYYMEHPDKIDLKELSTVLGEQKTETNLNVKGADELFGNLVIKENEEAE